MLTIGDTTYGKSATVFRVILKDANGNALNGQKVSLNINGNTYSQSTNVKGVALVKTSPLDIGYYAAYVSYGGNSNYAASSIKKTVKVTSSISASNLVTGYGYASVYKVSFYKNDVALANTEVTFTINKNTYKRVTDKNGLVKFNLKLPVGKYNISIYNSFTKETVTKSILVKKDNSTFKQIAAKTYIIKNSAYRFTVGLKSVHNLPIKNATVYFSYNGKVVSDKTDATGKASIVIPGLSIGK